MVLSCDSMPHVSVGLTLDVTELSNLCGSTILWTGRMLSSACQNARLLLPVCMLARSGAKYS